MARNDDEEQLLRSVALQNAQSIMLARQRAEDELARAKAALERRTTELTHSLAMMRATLESTTDGILVTEGGGRVADFNRRYVEMWRVPSEVMDSREHQRLLEVCGRQFDDSQAFLARVDEIYATSPSESYDVLELADGRVLELYSRIRFDDGRNLGRVWSVRDVTEQRRAEEARFRLAAIVDSSDDAIVSKSLDGVIRSWNEGARRIFGYAAEEVIGKLITLLLPGGRVHEEEEILRRLQRGERVQHFETVRIHKDGRLIDVSATISPIRDSTGRIIGASKIARDITERKRAEQTAHFLADASAALAELTDYESTLQRIAGLSMPFFADWCAVDLQEADGSLRRLAATHANPAKPNLASGELDRWHPPQPWPPRAVMEVLRTGEPNWAADIADSVRADLVPNEYGEWGWKSYICVPLSSRSKTLGTLTFVTAVSGRSYDAADVRAAEDLAHRAAVAVENAKLLAELKEADRRKDEFLAILAHELRNPLAPVRNAVQILRARGPPDPDLEWARDVIDRQVEQMARLVDDLLDVSRITRGKIELRKERVELAAAVNDAVIASRSLVEKCGHTLTVGIPPEPLVLEGDPTRLAQVLLNLLNNAAKYTDQGGHIWLTGEREGGQVVVRVKDTGVGIPTDMLPRLFDMFTQVERSLARSQGGLGIGLTLVQRLVAMHGGTVEAHSPGLGKGSEFVVRLPLSREASGGGAQRAAGDDRVAAAAKCRILVVDDNRDAADSLAKILRMMNHEVRTAYDGMAAVGEAEVFKPRAILLDIGLPELNGYEVARRIRTKRGGEVMLIALTGWGQEEDRRRSQEAGFDHHMAKPVDFDALNELLANAQAHDPERD